MFKVQSLMFSATFYILKFETKITLSNTILH